MCSGDLKGWLARPASEGGARTGHLNGVDLAWGRRGQPFQTQRPSGTFQGLHGHLSPEISKAQTRSPSQGRPAWGITGMRLEAGPYCAYGEGRVFAVGGPELDPSSCPLPQAFSLSRSPHPGKHPQWKHGSPENGSHVGKGWVALQHTHCVLEPRQGSGTHSALAQRPHHVLLFGVVSLGWLLPRWEVRTKRGRGGTGTPVSPWPSHPPPRHVEKSLCFLGM